MKCNRITGVDGECLLRIMALHVAARNVPTVKDQGARDLIQLVNGVLPLIGGLLLPTQSSSSAAHFQHRPGSGTLPPYIYICMALQNARPCFVMEVQLAPRAGLCWPCAGFACKPPFLVTALNTIDRPACYYSHTMSPNTTTGAAAFHGLGRQPASGCARVHQVCDAAGTCDLHMVPWHRKP